MPHVLNRETEHELILVRAARGPRIRPFYGQGSGSIIAGHRGAVVSGKLFFQSHRRSDQKSLSRRRLRLEQLEPRIVLSGGTVVELSIPDASTWAVEPYALSKTAISMAVRQATYDCDLEYYFHNKTIADHDSGWQNDVTYVDMNLTENTTYEYEVKARNQDQEEGSYSTVADVTTLTAEVAQVQYLANQIRAIETFSSVDNPGQISDQLRKDGYPDPTAPNNTACEKSGTNGLAAYPGDGRNTPGAFQVDLANIGGKDPNNPWLETFGQWDGTAGSAKASDPNNTRIALSKATLSEFFGIEVDADGLITKIGAPAASVFLHDDALANSLPSEWDSANNPLIGIHIDNFQSEQLSLYLAGRAPKDSSTGVTDPRTSPPAVMHLSEALQYQTSKSFMWAVYQKYLNHDAYKATFAKVVPLYGATLKITSSQGTAAQTIFGVKEGDVFWCRLTPAFVLGGAYVSGEGSMFNLLTALVTANETGEGTWVIDPQDTSKDIHFKRVTPAGTAAKDAVFTIDKTPQNVGANYPTILHYGAVMSPFGTTDYAADPVTFNVGIIDMNNKAAWGVKDRTLPLGYSRMPAAATVSGSQTLATGGSYIYDGLADGGTLTLTGSETFVIVGKPASDGPTITADGYPLPANNSQSVSAGQTINVSDFFTKDYVKSNEDILNSSFYVWQGAELQVVAVGDVTSTIPAATAMQFYFMPEATKYSGQAAVEKVREVISGGTELWNEQSPWYHTARLSVTNVDVLGRTANADEWAQHFITTAAEPGTGVIDASLATGKVLITINDTIKKVQFGSGCTTALASLGNTGRKTYVLNPNATSSPTIALRSNDLIDWSGFTQQLNWNAGDPKTFNNKIDIAKMTPPYLLYSYFDCWSGEQGSQPATTFQAIVCANTNTGDGDPTKVVENALTPPKVTINQASGQADQTSASLLNFTVVFNEAMADFDENDVTVVGPAGTIDGAGVVVTNPSGDKINYGVAVTLVDTASTGAVSTMIAEGTVHDVDGFTNLASTSTHNNVAYNPNTIAGEVRSNDNTQALAAASNDGEPLPGVSVSLKSQAQTGFVERTTTTDSNGCYQFENVPKGTYQVTVTRPGACLPGGSDTTVVSVEGSQSYEADFEEGALKPDCIPNRMMVTSSLPVGSTQWRLVVQEALNLGAEAASQAAQLETAETSQAATAQYLVLSPRAASAVADSTVADSTVADTPVPSAGNAASVNAADVQAVGVPAQVAQETIAPVVQEENAPVVEAAVAPVAEEATTTVAQESVAPVVEAAVAPIVQEPVAPVVQEPVAPVVQEPVTPIAQEEIAPIAQEAVTRWMAAGVDQQALSKMQDTTFVLSDLADLNLGMTIGNTVWLDRDAAGRGWFVDSTPNDDNEFTSETAGGQLRAVAPEAVDQIDLLSVVAHELGHVAGLNDSDINALGLMNPSLETGLRLAPSTRDVASVGV